MTKNELITNFQSLESWDQKYKYIIDLGNKLPGMDDALKLEEHLVKGCTSKVWLVIDPDMSSLNQVHFHADSDSKIVKGLVAILFVVIQDKPPLAILQSDIPALFETLELSNHLSPSRTNGFFSMIKHIQHTCIQMLKQLSNTVD